MPKSTQRSRVTVDVKLNRLYITLGGTISKQVAEKLYTDIRFAVADLQPGFTVINDLREGGIGYLGARPAIQKIMNYLQDNQLGQVVRIVGVFNTPFRQLDRLTSKGRGYNVHYVSSREEAEIFLRELTADRN